MSLGCGALVIVLLAVLLAGVFQVDQGVRLVGERARERVLQLLPRDLEHTEYDAIANAMQRIFAEAEESPEGADTISRFIREVTPLVQDGRMDEVEVGRLVEFLEELDVHNAVDEPGEE